MQQTRSERSDYIIRKYGNGENFAKTFNPELQVLCAKNIERVFTGDAPTIGDLLCAYPEKQIRVWIMAQIENLNTFAGAKNKMDPAQMLMLSDVIITEYFYFKASELLLFFFQFKSGKFGELYGSVDPLRISSALAEFASYRRDMLFVIERNLCAKSRKIEDEEYRESAITYAQYCRLKFKKNINQGK